ncbi:hypothetical protein BCR34DRAFT_563884 [Clohesyomyces aquaticus]|uniref:Uncharacterized protein n=1 Tax=Clohesyomyces aquaticus TaxID=1231657 RepID=A0A1Y1ZQ02_9PLEO|nr:hypothetical protein BCR34DRAFT_563884 [Clohesyomyces aquaticus]
MALWNALIRTHHITSRKKVAKLRAAASNYNVYALLRSGSCPGMMYCQGEESDVKDWVSVVQHLRYKDFQLVMKAAKMQTEGGSGREGEEGKETGVELGKLHEAQSVKEFGARMEQLGIWDWWRKGMGYVHND